jgi:hypothetical protein
MGLFFKGESINQNHSGRTFLFYMLRPIMKIHLLYCLHLLSLQHHVNSNHQYRRAFKKMKV